MITTTIFSGRYIQGAGALKDLGQYALVICDPFHNEPVPVSPVDVVVALNVMNAEGQWRKRHNPSHHSSTTR
jgi:hypothetical protein